MDSSIENINNKIKEKTKDEKKILDDAIEKYQNKINEVLQEKEIIEENNNIEISTNKMKKAIGLASKKFFTKRERIFNDTGLLDRFASSSKFRIGSGNNLLAIKPRAARGIASLLQAFLSNSLVRIVVSIPPDTVPVPVPAVSDDL